MSHVTRIGIHAPNDYAGDDAPVITAALNECTDMAYSVTECSDGIGFIIETWHDAVGLTTYWRATNEESARAFVSRMDDAHDPDCGCS